MLVGAGERVQRDAIAALGMPAGTYPLGATDVEVDGGVATANGRLAGSVLSLDYLRYALELAERYDFVIASDECYAELYRDDDAPPPSEGLFPVSVQLFNVHAAAPPPE